MPEIQAGFTHTEERVLTLRMHATPTEVAQFGEFVRNAGQTGFSVTSVRTHELGQSDPVVTGITLRLQRTERGGR